MEETSSGINFPGRKTSLESKALQYGKYSGIQKEDFKKINDLHIKDILGKFQ